MVTWSWRKPPGLGQPGGLCQCYLHKPGFQPFDKVAPKRIQVGLFDRKERSGREAGGRDLAEGVVPHSLREAVKELKLKLGYSPLYRVVEVDPWSRIPERRHALLNFDP